MKFLSVTGPKEDIDRVVNDYLSKYEIHLKMLFPSLRLSSLFVLILRSILIKTSSQKQKNSLPCSVRIKSGKPTGTISIEEASETLATLESKFSDIYTRTNALEAKKEDLKASYERLRPFLDSILIFTAYCSLSLSNIVSVRSHAITTKTGALCLRKSGHRVLSLQRR